MREKIKELIFSAIDELNETLDEKIPTDQGEQTPLYSAEGRLDSLGLVSLLAAVESNLEDDMEITLTIADERAMSQSRSPFKDVQSLTDYVVLIASEQEESS